VSELALFGGPPAKTKPFPDWPVHDERERAALLEVLDSGVWWRTPGTRVAAFEQAFAELHEARHGIAITNGTHALEVAVAALGIGPGDEVLVPDSTFVATAGAVLSVGALPVLVDVKAGSGCLDPELAASAIGPGTVAMIVVHMGGHPADLDALAGLAESRGIALIEDCAHAHASRWRDRPVGTHGALGTFSFQMSKLLTCGEGGIVITDDDDLARRLRSVHDCGRREGEWFYAHFEYGSNFRMSEWQGAVLSAQLERLDEQTRLRHANGIVLDELLGAIEGVTPQPLDPRCTRNSHYAHISHIDPEAFAGVGRDRLVEALAAEGIPNQAAYPPLHELDLFTSGAYRRRLAPPAAEARHAFLEGAFPESVRAGRETFWVPQTALLGDELDMEEIAAAFEKVRSHADELEGP
jgi:dTDP-4-amino-4,6-dideoxygalactose transaminase